MFDLWNSIRILLVWWILHSISRNSRNDSLALSFFFHSCLPIHRWNLIKVIKKATMLIYRSIPWNLIFQSCFLTSPIMIIMYLVTIRSSESLWIYNASPCGVDVRDIVWIIGWRCDITFCRGLCLSTTLFNRNVSMTKKEHCIVSNSNGTIRRQALRNIVYVFFIEKEEKQKNNMNRRCFLGTATNSTGPLLFIDWLREYFDMNDDHINEHNLQCLFGTNEWYVHSKSMMTIHANYKNGSKKPNANAFQTEYTRQLTSGTRIPKIGIVTWAHTHTIRKHTHSTSTTSDWISSTCIEAR